MQKNIDFNSYDGTKLKGIVQIPNNKIKGAFLLLHGCPSEKNEWGFYSDMAEYFEKKGYASFRFDYREQGDNQKSKNMENLSLSGMISDTEAGFCVLQSLLPENTYINIVGTSFAGCIAIKWQNIYNKNVKNFFLMAPLLKVEYTIEKFGIVQKNNYGYKELNIKSQKELSKNKYLISGGKKMNKAFINEVLMMNMKNELSIINEKIFIFHGNKDTIVPYEHSEEYIKYAKLGKLYPVNNADHGFAVDGDDDLIYPETKENHFEIYKKMVELMDDEE